MSTEVPKPPKTDPPVDPDNFHVTDEPATAPDGLLANAPAASNGKGGKGTVKPDNFHVTDTPQG